ncbi:MAG: diphthamide biosynthesis enzyme Dph2 [Sulfolobaceae archaeon]
MNYNFNETFVIEEIKRRNARKVLLQFPEGLRIYSLDILKKLKEELSNVEFIISAEPNWGACDVAEDEAQILGVDLIVHFGHSPYTWYFPKFPTIFVEVESLLDINENMLEETVEKLRYYNAKKVSINATAQHRRLIGKVKSYLERYFEVVIGKPSNKFMFDGQVLGCDYYSALTTNADTHVIISGGVFHAIGLGLATNKPVIKIDPYTSKVEDITPIVWKTLKVRISKVFEAMNGKRWVIIQGLKVGQNRPLMVKFLKEKLEEKGFEVFVVSNKVLSVDTLRNLDRGNVDVFVVTSCPRIPTDDLYDYEKPVLTPGEAKMIILNKYDKYIFPW